MTNRFLLIASALALLVTASLFAESGPEPKWIAVDPARAGSITPDGACWEMAATDRLDAGVLKVAFNSAPELFLAADDAAAPLASYRKLFDLPEKTVQSATLSVAAGGAFTAWFCGQKAGSSIGVPGADGVIPYFTFDLTERFREEGTIGPYCVDIQPYTAGSADAAEAIKVIALLEIRFEDGACEKVVSDDSWMTTNGAILYQRPDGGSIIDAGFHFRDFRYCGYAGAFGLPFSQHLIAPVITVAAPRGTLKETETSAPKEEKFLKPGSVEKIGDGVWIADFGKVIEGGCAVDFENMRDADLIKVRYLKTIGEEETPAMVDYLRCGEGNKPQPYRPCRMDRRFRYVEFSSIETRPYTSGWGEESVRGILAR
ncbi:MAG: alpha-L-rhamnosidase N-terminal domain-containing protein [Thermoguttaceae bacterium]|nr:alpha-L-rhamnosidase N-terminal domain-containing protein [Thermoguttaceae bacterium]